MLSLSQIDSLVNHLHSNSNSSHVKNSWSNKGDFIAEISKSNVFSRSNPSSSYDIARNGRFDQETKRWLEANQINTWLDVVKDEDWVYGAVMSIPGKNRRYLFLYTEGFLWCSFLLDRSSQPVFCCVFLNYEKCATHDMDSDFELFESDSRQPESFKPEVTLFTDDYETYFCFRDKYPTEITAFLGYEPDSVPDAFVAGLFDWSNSLFRERIRSISNSANNNIASVKSQLQQQYWDKSSGALEIFKLEAFMTAVRENQKAIQDLDPGYIHKFVKLQKSFDEQRDIISRLYEYLQTFEVKGSDIQTQINHWKDCETTFKEMCATYSGLQISGTSMINSLLESDMLTFYEIYETLDNLAIWDSRFEKSLLAQLENLNENISSLQSTIEKQSKLVLSSIEKLTERIIQQTHQITNTTEAVRVNNLIAAINAFQLYKINKNTKQLGS